MISMDIRLFLLCKLSKMRLYHKFRINKGQFYVQNSINNIIMHRHDILFMEEELGFRLKCVIVKIDKNKLLNISA